MTPNQPPSPHRPEPTQPRKQNGGGGWMLALLALPIICCTAPALLAIVGIGSVGALFALGTGQVLVAVLLGVAVVSVVITKRRGKRRSSR